MYDKEERRVRRKIKRMIALRKLKKSDMLVIFGACENSKIIMRMLADYGFKASVIVDNDKKKIGTYCSGIKVQAPDILKNNYNKRLRIIFYTYFEKEIGGQLISYGLKRNKDFYSLIDSEIIKKTCLFQSMDIIRGYILYKSILRKYGEQCIVLVCPYTGTGDIYLIGVLLQQYIEKEEIDNYALVVVSTACRKVFNIFGINNVVQMKKEYARSIIKINTFAPDVCNVVVLNDSWASIYTNPTEWLRGYKGLNFTDMFKYAVFELDKDTPLNIPKCLGPDNTIADFFEEHNLIPGKTVILAPYSNTLSELPDYLWEQIAQILKEKGYTVCTNSCGSQEPAVTGTEAVFFPLDKAIQIVTAAGGFIGVRSGFCDIISSVAAKKIIIYEKNNFFYMDTTLGYFGLNRMGLCDDAIEVEYDYKNDSSYSSDKLISEIMKNI